jgi:purine nucleosidase
MSVVHLIIDTDIGDDIDDAIAISFALRCPELNIVGITTVFGNTNARAKITSSLLRTAGHPEIPVYAGCGKPVHEPKDLEAIPCQYIAQEMNEFVVPSTHAVDFIIERVMNSHERISILAIGPLTNLAVALLKEPRLKEKLERIVIMGGAYYFHFIEWNIKCDPEAARIVFESGISITAVGLDVTKGCLMNTEQLNRLKHDASPLAQWLWQLIRKWRQDTGRTLPILHDALAVYGVFGNEYLRFEREAVAVELAGTYTRGLTFNLTDRDREEQLVNAAQTVASYSLVRTAKDVDSASFIEFFLERLLAGNGV